MASSTSDSNNPLTPRQCSALFDVLTHRALYAEITSFKSPNSLRTYGPPFQPTDQPSTSPILQTLLARFILRLPGLRDVDPGFWQTRIQSLIHDLAAAELSESYDKGVLGIRKTLATAISALVEYPARGVIGGLQRSEAALQTGREYDRTSAADVQAAFLDFVQQLIYGGLWEELFARTRETDDLGKQSSLVQGAHEFIVLNLASFMHYTLVLSPEGPNLLRMIENLHRLAPYTVVRQTLKIGNVATMISGVLRILLAKLSVSSITNWMGWSQDADEGMNLLQQIINQVLSWDKRDLKKRLEKVEKAKDGPPQDTRTAIDAWIKATREEHEETRRQSKEQGMSIVATILSLSSAQSELSEEQHSKAMEYLALQLAIRDRTEIVRVLCKSNPDQLTQGIKEGVAAYEPMIRQVHEAVDLGATLWDFEQFLSDMIKMSKPIRKDGSPPSVEDYVKLLHTHQSATHRFIHQVAKNGPEVTQWFKDYAVEASSNFRANGASEKTEVKDALRDSFSGLPAGDQDAVKKELDAYSKYLEALHSSSASRIKDVLANKTSTAYGPGAYLARWQELLDSTDITPEHAKGEVRKGRNKSVKDETSKDVDGKKVGSGMDVEKADKLVEEKTPDTPVMDKTFQLLLPRFQKILLDKTTAQGLQV